MLSISTLRSIDYYASEGVIEAFDYYSGRDGKKNAREHDPTGIWCGKFADRLGLPTNTKLEDFAAIYFGFDPNTGEALTKTADHLGFELFKVKRSVVAAKNAGEPRKDLEKKAKDLTKEMTVIANRETDPLPYKLLKIKQRLADKKTSKKTRTRLRLEAKQISAEIAENKKNPPPAGEKNGGKEKKHSTHRPGVDLTFSAPKDFSLLLASSSPEDRKRLLALFREAVEETLESVEREFAQTRVVVQKEHVTFDKKGNPVLGTQDVVVAQKTKGLAVVMFEHLGARPVEKNIPDPDAHFHCLVMSPVLSMDDKTRALFSDRIKRNIKALGAESRARLARKLSEHEGIEVVPDKQSRIVSFRLPGVEAKDRVFFSKRRKQIEDEMQSQTNGQDASVANLATRSEKGDWDRQKLIDGWSETFAKRGMTREDMLKSSTAAHKWTARTDERIINDLQNLKAHFSVPELRQALWEEAQFVAPPEGLDLTTWVDGRLNSILKNPDLLRVTLPAESIEANTVRGTNADDEPIFTTISLIRREIALDKSLGSLGKSVTHAIAWSDAKGVVEALEANKAAATEKKEWSYRDDQRGAIAKVLAGPDLCFIQAFAGTGKTTAAAAMIEVWKSRKKRIFGLAPSNKAAGQLAVDCNLATGEFMTVAKFLHMIDNGKLKDGDVAGSVIFIDEASMVGFDDAEKLVTVATKNGCKIVFQGDSEQLPSVPKGRFFANAVENRLGSEAAELTVITRQREQWAKAATEAAARGMFAEALDAYDSRGMIHTEGADEALYDAVAKAHLADNNAWEDKIVVASRNSDVEAINMRIRLALVKRGMVDVGHELFSTVEGREKPMMLGARDRIVFCAKAESGSTTANNGDLATVLSVTRRADDTLDVKVRLDRTGGEFSFNTADFASLDHAYAITVHKSQGATVNNCRYLYSEFVSSELAYVGMSRHRDGLEIFVREDRKSGMAKMMGKKIEKWSARDLADHETLAELNAMAESEHAKSANGRDEAVADLPAIRKAAAQATAWKLPTTANPMDELVAKAQEYADSMERNAHEIADSIFRRAEEQLREAEIERRERERVAGELERVTKELEAARNERKRLAKQAEATRAKEISDAAARQRTVDEERLKHEATEKVRKEAISEVDRKIENVKGMVGQLTEQDRISLACHLAGIGRPKAANPHLPNAFGSGPGNERILFDTVGTAYTAETGSDGSSTGSLRIYESMNAKLKLAATDAWRENQEAISQWTEQRLALRADIENDLADMRAEFGAKFPKPPKMASRPAHQSMFLDAMHIRELDTQGKTFIEVNATRSTENWVFVEPTDRTTVVAIPKGEFQAAGFDYDTQRGHRIKLPLLDTPDGTVVPTPERAAGMGAGQTMAPSPKPTWADKEREN
jgi:conjugative relaxase-like TrwC/TraI family protein